MSKTKTVFRQPKNSLLLPYSHQKEKVQSSLKVPKRSSNFGKKYSHTFSNDGNNSPKQSSSFSKEKGIMACL